MKFRLAWLLFVASPAFANGFVGNPGEGICPGRLSEKSPCGKGMLQLRDFYEYGVTAPWFGTEQNPEIVARLAHTNADALPFSRGLMARKLTDFQKIQAHMGFFLLAALNTYQWVLLDSPLTLLPDDPGIVPIAPSERVQIANRFQSTIYVNRAAWSQLSEEGRVALLIHEMVYSFITPLCAQGTCYQSAPQTREIVAWAFREPLSPGQFQLTAPQAHAFNLDPARTGQPGQSSCFYGRESLDITTWSGNRPMPLWQETLANPAAGPAQDKIQQFCVNQGTNLQLTFRGDPFVVEQSTYTAGVSSAGPINQTYLKVRYRPSQFGSIFTLPEPLQCHTFAQSTWFTVSEKYHRQFIAVDPSDPCAPLDL